MEDSKELLQSIGLTRLHRNGRAKSPSLVQTCRKDKVAVVGAGVSGLAAAYRLKSYGSTVTLLEAGRKLRSISYNGLIWDEEANTMASFLNND